MSRNRLLMLGAAAVVLFLVLRRRSAARPSPTAADPGYSPDTTGLLGYDGGPTSPPALQDAIGQLANIVSEFQTPPPANPLTQPIVNGISQPGVSPNPGPKTDPAYVAPAPGTPRPTTAVYGTTARIM